MTEFLQNYGFFVLVFLGMAMCHLGHGRHGGDGGTGEALKTGTPESPARGTRATAIEGISMHSLNWKIMTWSVGLFCAVSFVLCVLYGLVVPRAWQVTQFLEITLPGFKWLSIGSFVVGLLETFLYGAYAGMVFTWVHNAVARRVQMHALRSPSA